MPPLTLLPGGRSPRGDMQAAAKELLGFLTRHSLGLVGDRRARGARWLLERLSQSRSREPEATTVDGMPITELLELGCALERAPQAEKAKTTALQAQRDEVKEAARAALAAFDAPEADLMVYCTHEAEGRCDRVGTRCDDDVVRCDEHAWPRLQTLSYAPALRRLRALTKEEG